MYIEEQNTHCRFNWLAGLATEAHSHLISRWLALYLEKEILQSLYLGFTSAAR